MKDISPLVPHKCDLTSFPYLSIEVEKFLASREWISFKDMDLQPQTLRKWVMDGSGSIQPIKICNRLKWKLKDIDVLCNAHRGAK